MLSSVSSLKRSCVFAFLVVLLFNTCISLAPPSVECYLVMLDDV